MKKTALALLLLFAMAGVPAKIRAVPADASAVTSFSAIPGVVHGNQRTLTAQTPDAVARRKANLVSHHRSTATLRLDIGLAVRDAATLDAIIAAASDPHNPAYGHYLSNAEYMARFAPTTDQVQAVRDWAKSAGLAVRGVSRDNLLVTVSGTTSQVERAFSVTLDDYSQSGHTFMSNDRDPVVPAALPIRAIGGLSTIRVFHTQIARLNATRPGGYYPGDFRSAYNMNPVGDASGQTIGFTLWGAPVSQSDLNAFASQTGTPAITSGQAGANGIDWIPTNGGSADSNELVETAMDVEYAHGVAPNSHLKYWLSDCSPYSGGCNPSAIGLEEAINAAANDTSLHVVSNSWGGGEATSVNDPFIANVNASLQHAAAVGTTFYFSSGDSGSNSGGAGLPSFPADSPYVVSVGGTSLNTGSGYSYASESAWSGSGGGCSNVFARPAWQVSVGAATCAGRAEPDVSADADPSTGAYVYVEGGGFPVGGTSLAAPLWAGMTADVNRYLGAGGVALMGFAAPRLYQLATNGATASRDFHDVTNGSDGYLAGAGWDQATGWGSPNLANLSADWSGAPVPTSTPTPTPLVPAANYSFEAPSLGTGTNAYQYNPTGASWTFSGNAGITANGSAFFTGDPAAPDGTQVAFIQRTGSFQQDIGPFQAGTNYAVSFAAIQRAGQNEDFAVYLDTTLLGTFRPSGGGYTTYSTGTFQATAGTHTLKFVGLNSAGGDNTVFVDAVNLVPGTGPTMTPMPTNTPTSTPTSAPTSTPTATPTSTPLVPVANAGFESPSVGSGTSAYQYDPTGAAWTFNGNAGIVGNGSAFTVGDPNAPSGIQVAFIQRTGSFQQAIGPFQAGVNYAVSFMAVQRAGQNEDFSLSLDGTPLGTFRPSGSAYTGYATGTFQTTAGTHTLIFTGLDSAGGDNAVFIDDIRIIPGAGPTMTPIPTATATSPPTATATPHPCPCSIWGSGSIPAETSHSDPNAIEVGAKFRSDMAGYITGLRFYKGSANTGTHVAHLWASNGTLLASATFTNEAASGWQQISFATPVAILANTTYVASYHTNTGYAISRPYFATGGVDNPPLHALADGADGPNGVYVYGGSSFPTQTYQSTNYWVDVVFDSTPPPTPTATATPLVSTGNYSFEAPPVGWGTNAYQYDPTGASWAFSGNAGVSGNGSAFTTGAPTAPDGSQVGFIQRTGSLQQAISPFQAGTNYAVSFAAIQRAGQNEDFAVYLDATVLGTFRPSGGAYATYTTGTFQATAGTHTLTFTGINSAGGDNTAFIDNVRVVPGAGPTMTPTP